MFDPIYIQAQHDARLRETAERRLGQPDHTSVDAGASRSVAGARGSAWRWARRASRRFEQRRSGRTPA